ncbi:MAG: hypothetical protein AB7N24_15355 [Dehalococcoidia bacterium]
MTEIEHADVTDATPLLWEVLSQCLREFGPIVRSGPGTFPTDAKAAAERTAYANWDVLRVSYERGCQALVAGEAHLRAALLLAEAEPVHVLTLFSAVRSAMEQLGLARWILDRGLDPTTRAARAWGVRWRDLDQGDLFAKDVGSDAFAEQIRGGMLALATEADGFGLGISTKGDEQRITGIGIRQPGWTELFGDVFDFRSGYRLYSAVAHGTQWALVRVGGQLREGWDALSPELLIEEVPAADAVELSLRHALHAYVITTTDALTLFTNDPEQLMRKIQDWAGEVGLPIEWLSDPIDNLRADDTAEERTHPAGTSAVASGDVGSKE